MATIYHQVWINAPIARIYKAIATADGISTWWDKQTAVQTASGLILEHDPGSEHGVVQMKVLEMVPDERVEWECISTHPPNTPAASWTGTHILFQLTKREYFPPALVPWAAAIPAMTILNFRHSGWNENSAYLGFCSFAWAMALQKLQHVYESP